MQTWVQMHIRTDKMYSAAFRHGFEYEKNCTIFKRVKPVLYKNIGMSSL